MKTRQDNHADLDDDGPMRLPLMLATVAATIGLAVGVPALADPGPLPAPSPTIPLLIQLFWTRSTKRA